MGINEIRSFLAVADELHFSRAAERLHVAQPTCHAIRNVFVLDLMSYTDYGSR